MDENLEVIIGDAMSVLDRVPDGSCRACVTSPPYWSLRDYGHEMEIGQERDVESYIARLMVVFEQIKRVLADKSKAHKPKDLIPIPWLIALELQNYGWFLRSDIIWKKLNPMPANLFDRPTCAHEYVFLLSKQDRYFYDREAAREASGANWRDVWTFPTPNAVDGHTAHFPEELPKRCIVAGTEPGDRVIDPFAGSGTTGRVALSLGRRATLIEINPKYEQLINSRCQVTAGLPI